METGGVRKDEKANKRTQKGSKLLTVHGYYRNSRELVLNSTVIAGEMSRSMSSMAVRIQECKRFLIHQPLLGTFVALTVQGELGLALTEVSFRFTQNFILLNMNKMHHTAYNR